MARSEELEINPSCRDEIRITHDSQTERPQRRTWKVDQAGGLLCGEKRAGVWTGMQAHLSRTDGVQAKVPESRPAGSLMLN